MRYSKLAVVLAFLAAQIGCSSHANGVLPAGGAAVERGLAGPSKYAVIHRFAGGKAGAGPAAPVAIYDGEIYEPTASGGSSTPNCNYNCGTVVSMKTAGTGFAVLYKFLGNADGVTPSTKIVMDDAGALYGTALGGAYPENGGILYKLVKGKNGWKKSILHTFSFGADMDTPNGVILDKATSTLYGSTRGVHTGDCCGTVYSIKTDGSGYRILHTFKPGSVGHGSSDGADPDGALVRDPKTGALYGVTSEAGKVTPDCFDGCGTVFKLVPKGASFTFSVVYRFAGGSDGQYPEGALVLAPVRQNGHALLYGTTNQGGYPGCVGSGSKSAGCGTVYSMTDSGTEKILYTFHGPFEHDGEFPESGVTVFRGFLYGVTRLSGATAYDAGSLYRLATGGTHYAIVHGFDFRTDGSQPYGEPAADGTSLYGTTFEGGSSTTCSGDGTTGCGTIWRYTP